MLKTASSLKTWPQLLQEHLAVLPSGAAVDHALPAQELEGQGLYGSARLTLGNEQVRIAVACVQASGNPGPVRKVLARLEGLRSLDCVPLLVAPYLAPDARALLRERDINWLDLAGNFRFHHGSVYLEADRAHLNPFKTARGRTALFAHRAALVLDALLESPGRTWKVADLSEVSGASLGSVSKVRQELIELEWAQADALGLRLTHPDQLLDAWGAAAGGRRLPILMQAHTTLHGKALEEALRAAFGQLQEGANLLLAAHSVARRTAPFARVAGEFFYATPSSAQALRQFVPFEEVSKGGNLVFYDVEQVHLPRHALALPGGLRGTGCIRTYLDLLSTGERGREAADHFRREMIAPRLKEITRD